MDDSEQCEEVEESEPERPQFDPAAAGTEAEGVEDTAADVAVEFSGTPEADGRNASKEAPTVVAVEVAAGAAEVDT